jgi:hypothetical protein
MESPSLPTFNSDLAKRCLVVMFGIVFVVLTLIGLAATIGGNGNEQIY